MTGWRRSGGALVLLAGLCAGLGWLNYGQWTAASRAPEPVRPAEAQSGTPGSGELPPLPAARSFEMAALSSYAEIVSRPVFSPTRRPPTAARVVGEPVVGTLAVSLIGVILSADERIALIKLAAGARVLRLRENERLDGWTLVAIELRRVTFEQTGRQIHLTLEFGGEPPVAQPGELESIRPGGPGAVLAERAHEHAS